MFVPHWRAETDKVCSRSVLLVKRGKGKRRRSNKVPPSEMKKKQ